MLLLNDYIEMYNNPQHWYEKKEADNIKFQLNNKLIIKNKIGYINDELISLPVAKFAIYLGKNIDLKKQYAAILQQDYSFLKTSSTNTFN